MAALRSVRADDLVALVGRAGPFATVWLATPLAVGDDDPLLPAWRARRRELLDAGAPEAVVAGVEEAVLANRQLGAGLVVVADGARVLLVEVLAEPPRAELAAWDALPALSPVIEHRQAQVPYLVVLIDRLGADLVGGTWGEDAVSAAAGGADFPLTKVAPGGWSQSRFQQRAENTWDRNARDVADHVVRMAEQIDPSIVVVAGDVRAVQLLDDALPSHLRERMHRVTGGRAEDGSGEQRDEEVERLVRTAVAADTVAVLHAFERERGQQDQAADGVADTLDALRRAQVDVLLVHDDLADGRRVLVGPEPVHVALEPSVLAALGVGAPAEARLVDAAIRAALGTGASVRVVPASTPPTDHLGALLRWA